MNIYKKNPFLKYKMINDKSKNESVDKLLNSDKVHTNTINEPISSLIDYVKDKYNQDLSEEVKDYESKINRDKQE